MDVLRVDYIMTKEAAENWGITDRMVVYHCSAGRIKGAKKWEIRGSFRLMQKKAERRTQKGEQK